MTALNKQALRKTAEKAQEHGVFNMDIHSQTVLALLDELEKMQAQSSKWCEAFHKAVSVGARYEERIAELEAREVVLPRTQDVHPLGPQSAKIFCDFHRNIINRCADEIRKVGVNVSIKGE
ncbi:ead/Ea22-like family protein [Escherichia coli]